MSWATEASGHGSFHRDLPGRQESESRVLMRSGERHAGALLVDCLRAQGATRIFAVPGESFLPILDGLHDAPDIQLITARHEGGAAFMAEAHGKLTGAPGIAMVTRGPGATNASIGVHTAMQNSSPMILFIGQVATHKIGRAHV